MIYHKSIYPSIYVANILTYKIKHKTTYGYMLHFLLFSPAFA